jgi:hypothetical protein
MNRLMPRLLFLFFMASCPFLHASSPAKGITPTKAGMLRLRPNNNGGTDVLVGTKHGFQSALFCHLYWSYRPNDDWGPEIFIFCETLADCAYYRILEVSANKRILISPQFGNGAEFPSLVSCTGDAITITFEKWEPTRGGVIPAAKYFYRNGQLKQNP